MPVGPIQVAGVKTLTEAQKLLNLGVDLIGFPLHLPIHPEDVSEDEAVAIIQELGKNKNCVLITYLERCDKIVPLLEKLGVSNIQLHGVIIIDEIKKLRIQQPDLFITKSVIVAPDSTLDVLEKQIIDDSDFVDAFIIDTYDPATGASGATGKTQDWNISQALVASSPKPVILAGGLTPDNVYDAILKVRSAAVDVHTGVEGPDGSKDTALVAKFVSEARRGFADL